MKIQELTFNRLDPPYPEKYDVLDDTGKQIATVTLNDGLLKARCGWYTVYSYRWDTHINVFNTVHAQAYHLRRSARAILNWIDEEKLRQTRQTKLLSQVYLPDPRLGSLIEQFNQQYSRLRDEGILPTTTN